MRDFEYFLFENFDADKEANNPQNPRNFLGRDTGVILSEIAQNPKAGCSYDGLCSKYGALPVRRLMDGGVLRRCGKGLAFDCPVFLRGDAAVLHTEIASKASALADLLGPGLAEIRACCCKIDNGFSIELNLYHILCGMVFDGAFFDYLSAKGALAVSRQHPSGLDYLTVIYEKCTELQALSDGLLCSYNRFVNAKCSLQSFGDSQGNRFDFYRYFRLMEQGKLPPLDGSFCAADKKDALLDETLSFIQTGRCAPAAEALLERFGYAQDNRICVPVYGAGHQKYIIEIENIVEQRLGEPMSAALTELAGSIDIAAVRHGVNPLEIANELYHILFGSINEELAARGIVAEPEYIPGEGRYFKCIQIY